MLIAKHNLKIEDFFTFASEAEMARLNDTCVDRSNAYFVQFFIIGTIEGIVVGCRANGLWPLVSFKRNAEILGYLSFKTVNRPDFQ